MTGARPLDRVALFDAHLHVVDPRFPLVPNNGYVPDAFTVDDYRARTAGLRILGGAVVSGSFQAYDQTYLLDALSRLGDGFVGVTQLPPDVSDAQILELAGAGVVAVRFNLYRGGSVDVTELSELARRAFALAGWHTELYVDSRELPSLEKVLLGLPRVSIDHLGLSRDGLPQLLRLVERGVKVKATGFARGDLDVRGALHDIAALDPTALMVGTDLPSTRSPRPFEVSDLELVLDALGPDLGALALYDNARAFYLSRPSA